MREHSFEVALTEFRVPPPHQRMLVYRNNIASSLINALRIRYPVTGKLVGKPAFSQLAGDYAVAHLPQSPVLIHYGDAFPVWVAASEAARSSPYLGDLAALESLWWKAYHAAEAEPLRANVFASLSPEALFEKTLAFHPSAFLLRSRFAVGSIWEAGRADQLVSNLAIDMPENVLLWRPRAEVLTRIIPQDTADFLSVLLRGISLGEAAQSVLEEYPAFDLGAQLASLLQSELLVDG